MAAAALLGGLAAACTGNIGVRGAGASGAPAAGSPPATAVSNAALDGGRVTMHRLNKTEYNNTVRDLLGLDLHPADQFPVDEFDYGFDTIGRPLNFSPLHGDLMESAAGQLVDAVFALPATDARRTQVLSCDPAAAPAGADACTRQIVTAFARRAFRRPPQPAEIDRLALLATTVQHMAGAAAQDGVRAALQAVLLSPQFLFHVEHDPDPSSVAPHPINDFELASRLSYFLWASMPDDALLASADAGRLTRDASERHRQLTRMLADPKAASLVHDFAGEWLQTRGIGEVGAPLSQSFPAFNEPLRAAMAQETGMLLQQMIAGDEPIDHLLLADYTFVNAPLAMLYGMPAPQTAFQRVAVAGGPRGGLLTDASFLFMTSHPDRTSPVRRGAWVLSNLLCSPPPPPPPGVPQLVAPKAGENATLRQKMEAHRGNPMCAGCHASLDPIGLGLENFDAIGAYRTTDNGQPVDATGLLPDGKTFTGAAELSRIIASDTRFLSCVTSKMLTYAVGRSFDGAPYVDTVMQQFHGHSTWGSLITAVVDSQAFNTRRAVSAP